MKTSYEESQDLIQGQKQHKLETATLFSKIKKVNGLTMAQVSHIEKLREYMNRMEFDVYDMAPYLGVTPGVLLDILSKLRPLTEEMQQTFYKYGGFKFSTGRLNEMVAAMQKARRFKYHECWVKYSYAMRTLPKPKSLCVTKMDGLSEEQCKIAMGLKAFRHPYAGKALKFYRASFGDTQYTIPEKLLKYYGNTEKLLSICTRDFWHHVETGNYISEMGNRALYRLTGFSLEQIVDVFMETAKQQNINLQEQSIENICLISLK